VIWPLTVYVIAVAVKLAAVFGAVTELGPLKVYPANDGVTVYVLANSPVKLYCPFDPVIVLVLGVPLGPPANATVTPLNPAPDSVICPLIVYVPVAVKLAVALVWLEDSVIVELAAGENVAPVIEGVTV